MPKLWWHLSNMNVIKQYVFAIAEIPRMDNLQGIKNGSVGNPAFNYPVFDGFVKTAADYQCLGIGDTQILYSDPDI